MKIDDDNLFQGFVEHKASCLNEKDTLYYVYQAFLFLEGVQEVGLMPFYSDMQDLDIKEVIQGFKELGSLEMVSDLESGFKVEEKSEEQIKEFCGFWVSDFVQDYKEIEEKILSRVQEITILFKKFLSK